MRDRNRLPGNQGGSGEERSHLLERLRSAGVSERVSDALLRVPREEFVPPGLRSYAWADESLPIGGGQTISQPSLVGRMIDQLSPGADDLVLDIGTGSGYQAAVLSRLVRCVITVERVSELRAQAAKLLERLGYENVEVKQATDELGWPESGPYDGIIVGAAAPHTPRSLIDQLAVGGRLVIPVGDKEAQQVVVIERTLSGTNERRLDPVRFVPLIGEGAWEQ